VERAALPGFVEPELTTLVERAPAGDAWLHEVKYDGYRMLARLERGRVRWLSRNGREWPHFEELADAVRRLDASRVLLDGELVALRSDGTTSFQDLQNAFGNGRAAHLAYFAFDLLHLDGYDLRGVALEQRKAALRALIPADGERLRYSDHVTGGGPRFFERACANALEGIVSKLRDRPYRSGRTRDWVKVKCVHQQEFVIVGFTAPRRSRVGLGALVLGVHEAERLRYAGRVGTGFDRALLLRLRRELDALVVEQPPLAGVLDASARRGVTWTRPELVAESPSPAGPGPVSCARRASSGCARTSPQPRSSASAPRPRPSCRVVPPRHLAAAAETVAGIAITHPERLLFPEAALTKLDLARYYELVAPRLMPHVAGRPLSVVRCPRGPGQKCFFQKHAGEGFPVEIGSVDVRESSGVAKYLAIDSVAGLVSLVQMGVIELHPWGSRGAALERPDRLVFDFDPAPGVPWKRVVAAASLVRERLDRDGLRSFPKTTGGKGLHVVVPLGGAVEWPELKAYARAIAEELARSDPRAFVTTASKAARAGRIFIDWLRNARGATAVAPWSVRARPGAPVAMPVAWKGIEELSGPEAFDVPALVRRLQRPMVDPWTGFARLRQALPRASRPRSR
jgi:bifunctional non-homologous end joining protein LigD